MRLMRDATPPVTQLAERVGLSQTPCWKRVQKPEAAGVIFGRVARGDPVRTGLGLTVFVEIESVDHTPEWRAGVAFDGLWLTAPERVLVGRVAERQGDASDADAEVVRAQFAWAGANVPLPHWTTIDAGGTTQKTRAAARATLESVLGSGGDGTGKPMPF